MLERIDKPEKYSEAFRECEQIIYQNWLKEKDNETLYEWLRHEGLLYISETNKKGYYDIYYYWGTYNKAKIRKNSYSITDGNIFHPAFSMEMLLETIAERLRYKKYGDEIIFVPFDFKDEHFYSCYTNIEPQRRPVMFAGRNIG